MKAPIIRIGNSRGIRIPKALLELCHIKSQVDIAVKGDSLVIHSIDQNPRAGWTEAFHQMHERQEDQLLMDDTIDLDTGQWEW